MIADAQGTTGRAGGRHTAVGEPVPHRAGGDRRTCWDVRIVRTERAGLGSAGEGSGFSVFWQSVALRHAGRNHNILLSGDTDHPNHLRLPAVGWRDSPTRLSIVMGVEVLPRTVGVAVRGPLPAGKKGRQCGHRDRRCREVV